MIRRASTTVPGLLGNAPDIARMGRLGHCRGTKKQYTGHSRGERNIVLDGIRPGQKRRASLILLGNRDEFSRQANSSAAFLDQDGLPDLLAGKDLEAGGTWLG